jgi:hypothetical protein
LRCLSGCITSQRIVCLHRVYLWHLSSLCGRFDGRARRSKEVSSVRNSWRSF